MAKTVTLGSTGIKVPQNGFGALPLQRVSMAEAEVILKKAYEGGMTFFDTARAYSDSEEKLGKALNGVRKNIFIATKTMAATPQEFEKDLETSLKMLKTDYIDIYQFHRAEKCFRPGDGTGMYECMEKAKKEGKILHIGITAHKIGIAKEAAESGHYETLQFPLSYISSERELELPQLCKEKNMGFIAMKALAGGLITNSKAAFSFMSQFDNVVPIWGIQRMKELSEWLSYMENPPEPDENFADFAKREKEVLTGDFCRGCGYCMPCPQGISINDCARMSLMVRRAPTAAWVSEHWQNEIKKIENCTGCGRCASKCPYSLDTPGLLRKNYEDYKKIISGEIKV